MTLPGVPFVPYALPVPEPPDPSARVAFVLHGILGNHTNWRGMARRLAEAQPGWQFHVVDHRFHGLSGPAEGPRTLEACADDLVALAERVGAPEVVVGHSFGGKVALALAARRPRGLRTVYVLDANPGRFDGTMPDDDDARRVLDALRDVPLPLPTRGAVVEALVARGLSEEIGRWMTTNLRRVEGGFAFTFDVPAAAELIADYFARDLWAPLLAPADDAPVVHLVRAGRSGRWDAAALERLAGLGAATAGRAHVLPTAGHWLHVDDPDGLLAILARTWPNGAAGAWSDGPTPSDRAG